MDEYVNSVLASMRAAFLPIAEQILGANSRFITWHASSVEGWLVKLICVTFIDFL